MLRLVLIKNILTLVVNDPKYDINYGILSVYVSAGLVSASAFVLCIMYLLKAVSTVLIHLIGLNKFVLVKHV